METRAGYMMVGLFVLASLIGTLGFFAWITRSNLAYTSNLYTIYFSGPVTGLTIGGPVNLLGVPVGTIRNIALDPDHPEYVNITIAIKDEVPIKEDAYASLELQGLTGYKFVQIYGGSHKSPLLRVKPGQRYPVIQARYSGVEEIMTTLPRMMTKLTHFVDYLNDTFNEENRKHFASTLKNVDVLAAALADSSGPLKGLIVDADVTMKTLNKEATKLSRSAHQAFEDIGAASKGISRYFEKNEASLDDLTQNGSYELIQTLSETQRMVQEASRLFEKLNDSPRSLIFDKRRPGITVE